MRPSYSILSRCFWLLIPALWQLTATPLCAEEPYGLAQIRQRGDGSTTWFQERSVLESEKFRRAWSVSADGKEANVDLLERLVQEFLSEGNRLPFAANRRPFVSACDNFATCFRDGQPDLIDKRVFDRFEGRWYGRWSDSDVDHHWSPVKRYALPIGLNKSPLKIVASQFAWIGDGYGYNLIVHDPDTEAKHLRIFGYVEHLENQDFDRVVARRPHIGIAAGEGRLIWVTAREVFFESVHQPASSPAYYQILGFDYQRDTDSMATTRAFSVRYSRVEKQPRDEFQATPYELRVQRRQVTH